MSVSLIIVVALTSTLMGAVDQSFVFIIGAVMFCITAGGVYVILRSAPYEQVTYDGEPIGSQDRRTASLLLRTLGTLGLLSAVFIGYRMGAGPALLILGIFLLPAAYFAVRDDGRVHAIDGEVATFVRALGSVAGATGSTPASALDKIDLKSMGSLEPHIVRLKIRLASHLPSELCWDRFKAEAGSELLRRALEMLMDGVELGGDADEIGEIAGSYASSIAELREKRRLTSSSFTYLVIPMHAAMTGLLLFILEIIANFNNRLSEAAVGLLDKAETAVPTMVQGTGLQIFQSQDLTMVTLMVTSVVVTLTFANALAAKITSGGHDLKLAFTLGVTCIISGANMIVVPRLAAAIFSG